MSQSLTRWQAAVLGLVVLAAAAAGTYGVTRIAGKQGVWADTFEVTVGFPEAHDITPGTPVRVRGVEAGQVVSVEYPADDRPGSRVALRMRLDSRFAGRLYADSSAQIHGTGLLGTKVISVAPGNPEKGPLSGNELRGVTAPDLAEAAAKLQAAAAEAEGLIRDARQSNGTLPKLLRDDSLYSDLKGVAADTRAMLKRADTAVGTVESEAANVRGLVQDGRDTLKSVKQGTDAVKALPVIRSYVEDTTPILVRPAHHRERMAYNARDLFHPGTALLTEDGRSHLAAVASWLNASPHANSEVVVAAFCDPTAADQTAASAGELTKKQAEAAAEFLRAAKVHKLGWWTRRPVTAVGMGMNPTPVVEKEPLPPSRVELLLFTPGG